MSAYSLFYLFIFSLDCVFQRSRHGVHICPTAVERISNRVGSMVGRAGRGLTGLCTPHLLRSLKHIVQRGLVIFSTRAFLSSHSSRRK